MRHVTLITIATANTASLRLVSKTFERSTEDSTRTGVPAWGTHYSYLQYGTTTLREYGRTVELATWASEVAQEQLAAILPRRWVHVRGVAERAGQIVALFGRDGELLVAAAVLHDVGYAPDLAKTGFHPLDGARYLRSLGASERLCGLVAHHSAARVEAEIRGLADQLGEFADERTPVRDALWYCDMVTGPDGQRFTFDERVGEITERYGPESVTGRFLVLAGDELRAAVERTQERLRAAGIS